MRLIIVRHGETEANVKRLIQGGWSNAPLNKKGIEQAKNLAKSLKKEKIDYIYSSDLKRASQTAQEIFNYHPKASLTKTKALRELYAGVDEGKCKGKSFTRYCLFSSYKPEGGESLLEAQERVRNYFNKIYKKHENDNILIVTHGVIISALFLYLFKKKLSLRNYKEYRHKNTAYSILEINKDNVKIIALNSVEHLND